MLLFYYFLLVLYCLWAIIIYRYGDLNNEWKEGAQNQISAYAVGSVDYHTNDLDHVHPGMQLSNSRLLTCTRQIGELYACGDLGISGSARCFGCRAMARNEANQRRRPVPRSFGSRLYRIAGGHASYTLF